ncbi:MAG TPA: DNA cytosine methyltransferase [Archangium sp.]|uniref:DNA cytosine methyltransferase n=1 Tax=Archangium sp. TaxID=1872627 RepID=UPI002E35E464|nr:DNA cytosine methyltransferase [Archangium sp.]HEX5750037.1 DNA cytosine methyltransferase [Archangium sp.]
MKPIAVVLFAGGGGADTGIEAALGRPVDEAANHNAVAMAVHRANHPRTRHHVANVWEVDPRTVAAGRPVGLLWASPDCTHFSKAKGAKPREQGIRSLAWVVRDWARDVGPDVIMLENVGEFVDWGPLYEVGHVAPDGRVLQEGDRLIGTPIPERKGETFREFVSEFGGLGYSVAWRLLNACHYGAPTSRVRLFLVARKDGQPITWPEPTHGPGRAHPYRTAAQCIDWSIPCPSIFERKRPLAEKTMWRIAEGIRKYVLENPRPFVVGVGGRAGQSSATPVDAPVGTITAKNDRALCVPTLIQTGYGERKGQEARTLDLHTPLGTVVAGGCKHGLVAAFLAKHYGDRGQRPGIPMTEPMSTVTATDHHALATATLGVPGSAGGSDRTTEVRAFLTTYYGEGSVGQRVDRPLRTITAKARLGLVTVEGVDYQITDIGMRMLEPHELLRAQFGRFADAYDMIAARSKAEKVRLIGNSVCPEVAEALVRANLGERMPAREAA